MAKIYCATFPTFANKLYNVFKKLAYPDPNDIPVLRRNDQSCWGATFPDTDNLIYEHLFPGQRHTKYWTEKKSTHKNSSEAYLHEPTATILLALNHIGYRIEEYFDEYLDPELELKILYHKFILSDCKDFVIPEEDHLDVNIQEKAKISYVTAIDSKKRSSREEKSTILLQNIEETFLPKFLNLIPNLYDKVIGREPELARLHEIMKNASNIVLLNGLGGVGKTTLAKKFLHDNKSLYRNIAWVSVTALDSDDVQQSVDNFMSAFADDKNLVEQGLNLQFETDAPVAKKFHAIMYKLQSLSGPNLLVIDNAEANINRFREELPIPPEWKLLITTRENIIGFEPFRLENLDEPFAIKLFEKWFENEFEITELKKLLAIIDYHTLMIELLAKTLTANLGLLSVNDLIAKLENKALDDHLLQDLVPTAHSKEDRTLLKHLLTTFKLSNLKSAETGVLQCFYFLPPEYYSIAFLTEMFGKESDKEFIPALKNLYHKGWLQYDGEKFHMHRLIQTVIYYALSPTLEVAKPYINILRTYIWNFNDSNIHSQIFYIPYATFLINQLLDFIEDNKELAGLCANLAIIYNQTGQFDKADTTYDHAIKYFIKSVETNDTEDRHALAVCYNGKSIVARHYNRKDSAWYFLNEALTIWRNPEGVPKEIYLINYIAALTGLGKHYVKYKQLALAEEVYSEMIQYCQELYNIDTDKYLYVALGAFDSLANVLLVNGKYEDAKFYADQIVKLAREVVEEDFMFGLNLADGLFVSAKIGYEIHHNIDIELPRFEEAIKTYMKFVELNESIYESHLADRYSEFGFTLAKAKQYKSAELQFRKAEALFNKCLKRDRLAFIYNYAKLLVRLGSVLILQEKNGVSYLEQAQELQIEMFENDEDFLHEFYETNDSIGHYYFQEGDYIHAVKYFESSKKHYQISTDREDSKENLMNTLRFLAICYESLRNLALAIDHQEDHYNLGVELLEESRINSDIVLQSGIQLKVYYQIVSDHKSVKEMLKKCFKLMHLYPGTNIDHEIYNSLIDEVEYLFGVNFNEWHTKQILI